MSDLYHFPKEDPEAPKEKYVKFKKDYRMYKEGKWEQDPQVVYFPLTGYATATVAMDAVLQRQKKAFTVVGFGNFALTPENKKLSKRLKKETALVIKDPSSPIRKELEEDLTVEESVQTASEELVLDKPPEEDSTE